MKWNVFFCSNVMQTLVTALIAKEPLKSSVSSDLHTCESIMCQIPTIIMNNNRIKMRLNQNGSENNRRTILKYTYTPGMY